MDSKFLIFVFLIQAKFTGISAPQMSTVESELIVEAIFADYVLFKFVGSLKRNFVGNWFVALHCKTQSD